MRQTITREHMERFAAELRREEKSRSTIAKYMRDIQKFALFLGKKPLEKEAVISYKEHLQAAGYEVSSINSFLVAANRLCAYLGRHDCMVRTLKMQRAVFEAGQSHLTQAEYERLVRTARRQGRERLALILQAIGSTGMRVSELKHLTVEALAQGKIVISCKGKVRTILLPGALQKALRAYAAKRQLVNGVIFCTRRGTPLDRSNIWREMKALCSAARVGEEKVFPHNLRRLFARSFYKIKKDIARLADVLGHSSVETTRIYIRTTVQEHRRQLDGMRMVFLE